MTQIFTRRRVLGGVALGALAYGGWRSYSWFTTRAPDFADVAYGPDARNVLDIYLPSGTGPFPYVIEIHGGAFKIGSKTMSAPSDAVLAAGIAIVRPNYRLSGTDLWPAQGEDCLAAALHVATNAATYRLDAGRVAVWGQSAGGFLAVSTALSLIEHEKAPQAVVSFYGPMEFGSMDADMATLGRVAAMGATDDATSAESQLLGFAVGSDRNAANAMGPVGRLGALPPRPMPPLFVRHGDADPLIAHLQSKRLVAAWGAVDPSAPVDFALVDGGGHGGGDFNTDMVMGPLVRFLKPALA